jgi:hypothetical protein
MNKISSAESSRLTVTYRPLGDLTPNSRNARTHPKRQIGAISTTAEHAIPSFVERAISGGVGAKPIQGIASGTENLGDVAFRPH